MSSFPAVLLPTRLIVPHSEGIRKGVGKVTRQERKKMKIIHKKRVLIHFFRDMNIISPPDSHE